MYRYITLILLFLCGCSGYWKIDNETHLAYYKTQDKEFSCYANKCCYPYEEKAMICLTSDINGVLLSIKIVPEK